jgi:hypothetical protein
LLFGRKRIPKMKVGKELFFIDSAFLDNVH